MATQIRWRPPIPLSPARQMVARNHAGIGKFYVFLLEVRAERSDEACQAELAAGYQPRGYGAVPGGVLGDGHGAGGG